MIHGLISLLYNGLLRGAAGAPLQRLTACLPGWKARWLPGSLRLCPGCFCHCCPRLESQTTDTEKRLSESTEEGCARNTHKRNRLDSILSGGTRWVGRGGRKTRKLLLGRKQEHLMGVWLLFLKNGILKKIKNHTESCNNNNNNKKTCTYSTYARSSFNQNLPPGTRLRCTKWVTKCIALVYAEMHLGCSLWYRFPSFLFLAKL